MNTKEWKKERAGVLRLAPRAWKPLAVDLHDRLFWVHADGKVYEQKGGRAHSGHGTVRRVKDREIVARVHAALRDRQDQRGRSQARAQDIVDRATERTDP